MQKLVKIFFILIVCFILSNINVYCINYYDLYFEKVKEEFEKGPLLNLNNGLDYKIKYNVNLSKDELDVIGHSLELNLNEYKPINKNQHIKLEDSVEFRYIYKVIEGKIVKDYGSWQKEKKVILKIPIDVKY
ncbi:Uncharacterised protein [[Clostridium] sordellii]|uniref:hypothetical protein n=1 Tax=Paraclostridium sordellii TaxID=1505 RepID=UPI0005E39F7B|nr:hypothetical protein [Paeniclostridium sordellii]CEQ21680.1 Uncharacterised protein [[Clostridium] sordellii] [Paeniclostridium sordellii]